MNNARNPAITVLVIASSIIIFFLAPSFFLTLDLSLFGRLGWAGYALLGAGLGAAAGMLAARRRYRLHGNVAAGAGGLAVVLIALTYFGNPVFADEVSTAPDTVDVLFTGRVVSRSGLNMRAEPSSSAEVVAKVPYYVTIDVVSVDGPAAEEDADGLSGNWYRATYEGKTGWIRGAYIRPLDASGQ